MEKETRIHIPLPEEEKWRRLSWLLAAITKRAEADPGEAPVFWEQALREIREYRGFLKKMLSQTEDALARIIKEMIREHGLGKPLLDGENVIYRRYKVNSFGLVTTGFKRLPRDDRLARHYRNIRLRASRMWGSVWLTYALETWVQAKLDEARRNKPGQ